MTAPASVQSSFQTFRDRRDDLTDAFTSHEVRDATLREGAMLAIGVLLGGGFPGSAACVSVLLEQRFPEERFPWNGGPA
jgi:hypothetical protein